VNEAPAGHTVVDAEPAQRVGAADAGTHSEPQRPSGHRSRFAVVYVALAVLAGAAVGAFAVLLAEPDSGPPAAWSTWEPTGSDSAKAKQIASHVSERYRIDGGRQLAVALVGPAQVSGGADVGDIPVRAIAIRPDTSTGLAEESDIEIVDAGSNLTFVLCGLGANCSIASGKPSQARHTLLRRESLELALYTFKYVSDIDSVTVFLPPNPDGTTAPTSVFLRKGDVQRELGKPLSHTLAPVAPGVGQMSGTELAAVNRVTGSRIFQYEYQQAQDGSAILILAPVATA
jgi:hypothetical protein